MNKQYITGFGQISHLGFDSNEALNRLQSPSQSDRLKLPENHLDDSQYFGSNLNLDNLSAIEPHGDFPYQRANNLVTHCVNEALQKAKISFDYLRTQRVGVCIGTTSAELTEDIGFNQQFYLEQTTNFTPFLETRLNDLASSLAQRYSLQGPILSINNACTSGTDVIGVAQSWIKQGLCDIVIAGGVDCILQDIYAGFRSLGLLSPDSASPFDKNREGLVLGEASGVVIVESGDSVHSRKIKPYCEVLGYGLATDSFHPTSPHPEALGLSLAVDQALLMANRQKDQVSLINAHATGTQANDQIEGNYLVKNFPNTPIFATKAYTGHSLGAAGTLEAIWGIFCINQKFIPATLGHIELDPEINLTPNLKVRDYETSVYLSTSLGFGGSNSAILLGEIL